ncbi:MAG: hydroxymethylbilane synthase [Fibrobacter sp.]|nr:hydroxymethylbilane synthase [Fibrobacter sp.]
MESRVLRIATRKSALALAQTTQAAEAIIATNSAAGGISHDIASGTAANLSYELVGLTTEGDRRLDKSLASFGGKGVFIKELEVALLEGCADIAIHSLKDMPAEVLPEFKLAAVLKREDPRDAFISRGAVSGAVSGQSNAGPRFMDLPSGARVGTGSIRRVVQLKALRPDLEYVPIRGNIQTRIQKLAGDAANGISPLDGVVLAAAGLKRMGLADRITEYFSTEQMLPASGQGILAIETLSSCHPEPSGSSSLADILSRVNDPRTYCIAVAEMAYLKALNAGCQFPVASFAEFEGPADVCSEIGAANFAGDADVLKIRGIYWDEKSQKLLRAECRANVKMGDGAEKSARALGIELAEQIKQQL